MSLILRMCVACDTTTIKDYESWYNHDGDWMCQKCWKNYVYNPVHNPVVHREYGPKRITFKGRRIQLSHVPRTGICSQCGAVKGKDCIRTALHHFEYHEDEPLKDTVELCPSCHGKLTTEKQWRNKK